MMRLREEGAAVTVAGPRPGPGPRQERPGGEGRRAGRGRHGAGLDAVVVPGGWAPDKLRRYEP